VYGKQDRNVSRCQKDEVNNSRFGAKLLRKTVLRARIWHIYVTRWGNGRPISMKMLK